MKTSLIAIDSSEVTPEMLKAFLEAHARFFPGTGTTNAAQLKLGLTQSEVLQWFLGIPVENLDRHHRVAASVFWSLAFGGPIDHSAPAWTPTPNFRPKNGRRKGALDLSVATLDLQFISRFGISSGAWDNILLSSTPGLLNDARKGRISPHSTHRAYLGLAIFGFPEPDQFFVD